MNHYLQAFLGALLLSAALTPVVRFLGRKWGIMDRPGGRKVHRTPVPRVGGLGIYIAFAAILWLMHPGKEALAFLVPGGLMLLVGLLDDIYDLNPGVKLLGQILAALALALSGVRIYFVTNPFGGMFYLGWLSIPATVLWVVGVVNVVNLVDGLDGLASGVVLIGAGSVFFVALAVGQPLVALVAAILGGTLLGFLPYNFNPASIFLGDGGSLVTGFFLAAAAAGGAVKGAATLALGVAIMALGVPIFDTAFAVLRRYLAGRPVYAADRDHLHHRLLARGFSQREVVLLVYGLTAVLGGMGLIAVKAGYAVPLWVILLGMAVLASLLKALGVLRLPEHKVHHLG